MNSLDISPDDRFGLSCGSDKRICLFLLGKSGGKPTYVCHTTVVNSAQFAPSGKLVVSAGNDKLVKLWQSVDGRLVFSASLKGHTNNVQFASFSGPTGNTGAHIASCADDGSVRIWDAASQGNMIILKHGKTSLNETHFAPDSVCPDLVSSCTQSGYIFLWDTRTSTAVQSYKAHDGPVNSMSFHSTLPLLLSGSDDCTLRLWDLRGGKLQYTIYGHRGSIRTVRFERAPTRQNSFVTASTDGHLLLWDSVLGTRPYI